MATPEPFTFSVASVTPSTVNETVPLGTPVAPDVDRFTVAVKVASPGGVTVVGLILSVVEVGALFSVTLSAFDDDAS